MNIRTSLLLITLMSMSLDCLAAEYYAVTPSGSIEMVFAENAANTTSKISGKCVDFNFTVTSSTGNSVICEAPLSMGQSILGQLALGNSYSTAPRQFYKFNINEIAGISRVQGSGWMETQMVFGQVQRMEYSGAEFHNNLMMFMESAGGNYPVGTTFPNHTYMGLNRKNVQQGKYINLQVTEVLPDKSAFRAGLLIGDVITKIAGNKFKNNNQYLESLEKAAKTATYQIEVIRNSQPITLTLDSELRESISQQVTAKNEASAELVNRVNTASVADELAKLLKLKDQGVLSQEEFSAQKAKLLN